MIVRSNSGFLEEFDKDKITKAISEDVTLAQSKGKISHLDAAAIKKISNKVAGKLAAMEFDEGEIINSDTIRGLVVSELYRLGENDVAKISEIVGIRFKDLDKIWGGNSYADNANINGKTPEAQHKYIADYISKKGAMYLLPDEVLKAHSEGRIHVHDLDYFANRPFCNEHDLRYYLYYGLYADGNGDSIPVAAPAKDASVAVLHAAKALGSAQGNFSGGQGFQNFLTFISPYLEDMTYKEIKQSVQMYIYEMSQMLNARGGQAVFSTTQLTPGVPEIFKDVPIVLRGKICDGEQALLRTYGEFEREVRLAFKAYTEIMFNGDAFGRPFSFPKYEVEVLLEHWEGSPNWDVPIISNCDGSIIAPSYKELWMDMCKLIAKDGTPYIHNALDTVKGSIKCYSCCAFTFQSSAKADPKFEDRLHFRGGEHFILGSKQVGTVNIVQAAMHAQGSVDLFMAHCKESIDLLIEMFKVKEECIGKQSLPFARQTPIDPNDPTKRAPPLWVGDDLPYCIGIVGLNEAVQAMMGLQIHEDSSAHKMAVSMLVRLQMAVMEASQMSGIKIAFARTPAETTAQRFAICDLKSPVYREQASKIIKGNVEYALTHVDEKDLPIYYTNGAMCANDADITVFERIRLEEHAFSAFDGGNIFHFFLGERNPEPEGIFEIVKMMLDRTNIKYFAFTRDYTICKVCNTNMSGLQDKCDKCGTDDVTQFSRITGYIQAVKGKKVSGWNKGKIEELKARKRYEIGE